MTEPVRARANPLRRSYALWIALSFQAVALFIQTGRLTGDDPVRYEMLQRMAIGHWPAEKFSVIMPAMALPLVRLGHLMGLGDRVVEYFGRIVWLACTVVIARVLQRERGPYFAIVVTGMIFCSMLSGYAIGFNVEQTTAMMTGAGLLCVLLGRSLPAQIAGYVLVVLSVANISAQLPPLLLVCIVVARRRRSWIPLLAPVATVPVIVTEASYHPGSLSFSKYSGSETVNHLLLPWGIENGFSHPLLFGLVGILFSLGRGLVFYIPALFLALRSPQDRVGEARQSLAIFVFALVPIYARWWAWYGGVTFGPRFFMLGAIPGAMALADRLDGRRYPIKEVLVPGLVGVWSTWVAIAALVFGITPASAYRCLADSYLNEPFCWYSAEYSSLFAPIWDHAGKPSVREAIVITAALLTTLVCVAPTVAKCWPRAMTHGCSEEAEGPFPRAPRPRSSDHRLERGSALAGGSQR